jgi:LacI family transcriptional regulator
MEKRSPLHIIAELLGVSRMTVSRALREGTSVTPELRAKIREAAGRLGYQPDSRISQVMRAVRTAKAAGYRETLAFIWAGRSATRADRALFDEEYEGARRRAQQLGYKLDEFRLAGESPDGSALSKMLRSHGIRGVLIAPPGRGRAHPHLRLDWKAFCCVLLGQSLANAGLARVQHDYNAGCALILRRLKRLNYQRTGLVMSRSMDERSSRVIHSTFVSSHSLGFPEAENLVFLADRHDPKALKKWIAVEKPDALAVHFEKPFPQWEQIRRATPPGLAIAALNWNKDQPEIAGIDQHRSAVGEQAIDLLLLRLEARQLGLDPLAPSIKVSGSWRDGASARPSCGENSKNRA